MSSEIRKKVQQLCERFANGLSEYQNESYNESQLRQDFLDPFFEILGWDIKNVSGKRSYEREVLVEEPLRGNVSENTKKPDYTFRLFSDRKFFLEAKKPFVKIESENEPSLQLRRYGYTANLKISVLSNFEYLLIYDTTALPGDDDIQSTNLIKKIHYSEYAERIDEIIELLGKESVYTGKFDEKWKDIHSNVESSPVNDLFLGQINSWRLALADEISKSAPTLPLETLNDVVQSYINKLVFLRVCEDRNIETYQKLLRTANEQDIARLIELFRQADSKFNSGLFDELLAPELMNDVSSVFWEIIHQLYYPKSPFSFSVLPSEILGGIYEIFLSKRLDIKDGKLCLIDKPDNVDKDIVTTPIFIIREILHRTVIPKIEAVSFDELCEMKFADIACGSGAFLLELFQLLCDAMTDYFKANDASQLIQTGIDTYRLPLDKKLAILKSCIYGVDKDYNSVEATKFGLLLKALEDENINTLTGDYPLLPDLTGNIFYGNSLLDFDSVPESLYDVINPFDFEGKRFDVIIGNPPYLDSEGMKNATPDEYKTYKKFRSAHKQYDKYFLFVERAIDLLKPTGILGYIIPSKFMKVGAGKNLRQIISEQNYLKNLVYFGANQIFSGKTNYTCLLILDKGGSSEFRYEEIDSIDNLMQKTPCANYSQRLASTITKETWTFYPDKYNTIFKKLHISGRTFSEILGSGNIFNGIQTSANDVYIFQPVSETDDTYTFKSKNIFWEIEKEITKPYFLTEHGSEFSSYRTFMPNGRVIFPYEYDLSGVLDIIPLDRLEEEYPKAYAYLSHHKERLQKRDIKPKPESDDEWHRYGRHQSLEACEVANKIIVGVLSLGDKYAIDMTGCLISSGGTAGYFAICLPKDFPYSIYYVQAILNSRPMEWLCSLYGEIFRGGYVARGTKVVEQLPFRIIDFSNDAEKNLHDKISDLQKDLISLGDQLVACETPRQRTRLQRKFNVKKREMIQAIKHLYSLTNEEYNSIPVISELYQ